MMGLEVSRDLRITPDRGLCGLAPAGTSSSSFLGTVGQGRPPSPVLCSSWQSSCSRRRSEQDRMRCSGSGDLCNLHICCPLPNSTSGLFTDIGGTGPRRVSCVSCPPSRCLCQFLSSRLSFSLFYFSFSLFLPFPLSAPVSAPCPFS